MEQQQQQAGQTQNEKNLLNCLCDVTNVPEIVYLSIIYMKKYEL